MRHAALDAYREGPVPVIAALHGAVIGGSLELASIRHVRVFNTTQAEQTTVQTTA